MALKILHHPLTFSSLILQTRASMKLAIALDSIPNQFVL